MMGFLMVLQEVSELDKMEDFQWTHICPSKYFLSWTLCVRAQWEGKAD